MNAVRRLFDSNAIVAAPGVYDALSARLAHREGFQLAYASGGSIVRSMGLPDLGLADLTQMAARIAEITAAAKLPVIADADNGYGNELNVNRTVSLLEKAGVAALHIEDQVMPKQCGHYADIRLIAADQMAAKVKAACAARHMDTVIIARTDALKAEGLGAAIERAKRYIAAGADMIFVEGINEAAAVVEVGRALAAPKLYNAGPPGTPLPLASDAMAALGFKIAIYPADLQCAAIAATAACLQALKRHGTSAATAGGLASLAERDALVDLDAWQAIASRRVD